APPRPTLRPGYSVRSLVIEGPGSDNTVPLPAAVGRYPDHRKRNYCGCSEYGHGGDRFPAKGTLSGRARAIRSVAVGHASWHRVSAADWTPPRRWLIRSGLESRTAG